MGPAHPAADEHATLTGPNAIRKVTKTEAMPAQDPALWLAHGMRVVGPPLTLL